MLHIRDWHHQHTDPPLGCNATHLGQDISPLQASLATADEHNMTKIMTIIVYCHSQ